MQRKRRACELSHSYLEQVSKPKTCDPCSSERLRKEPPSLGQAPISAKSDGRLSRLWRFRDLLLVDRSVRQSDLHDERPRSRDLNAESTESVNLSLHMG